jgi:hypothetical protein
MRVKIFRKWVINVGLCVNLGTAVYTIPLSKGGGIRMNAGIEQAESFPYLVRNRSSILRKEKNGIARV